MAFMITANTLSEAWLAASDWLSGHPQGKDLHLSVSFTAGGQEDPGVRRALDRILARHDCYSVQTVANTIFPAALYHPHLGEEARPRLYELHQDAMRYHRREFPHDADTYFNRLVSYPGPAGTTYNQLEYVVNRLAKQIRGRTPQSSAYELGLSEPNSDGLRVQVPGKDRNLRGFPCLSHISLTLERPRLHLAAIYRNQSFITRAYGNYLGLARLGEFIATEIGAVLGEVLCVATHADVEFDIFHRRGVEELLAKMQVSHAKEVVG